MDRATFAAMLVLNSKLNRILTMLGDEVMPELDALGEQITRLEGAAATAIAKIEQLIAQGPGAIDPAVVQGFVDRLKGVSDRLEAAAQ